MPWLMVDYDAGAGGERFCAELSKSPGCIPLQYSIGSNSRTKVQDRFEQGWLIPLNTPKAIAADPVMWEIVPCHRSTDRAKSTLENLKTIRIARPKSESLWDYMATQLEKKVWLSTQPSKEHYQGAAEQLYNLTGNPAVIDSTSADDDYLTMWLIAFGVEPNQDNRKEYLNNFRNDHVPEPDIDYDLIIAYEDLFFNHDKVFQDIYNVFGITIDKSWLNWYSDDYANFVVDKTFTIG